MAAREPLEPPPERTDYTVVEHRSNAGIWAFVIVLIWLAVAAGLYFAGVFNGRPIYSEKSNVNIKVAPPSGGTSGGGGGGTSGTSGGGQ